VGRGAGVGAGVGRRVAEGWQTEAEGWQKGGRRVAEGWQKGGRRKAAEADGSGRKSANYCVNPYRTKTQTSFGHTKAKVHGGMCHRGDKTLSVESVSRPLVLDDLASPKDARGTG